jgi:hypothetical protein
MDMKKIILPSFIIIVVAVVVAVLLFLSAPKESNYSLHLVVDSWSDQDIDYPEEEFNFENITLNKTYVIPLEGDTDYLLRKFKVLKLMIVLLLFLRLYLFLIMKMAALTLIQKREILLLTIISL